MQLLVDSGLTRLVTDDHVITPEVRLIPTPGHTPGHVSVQIESGGSTAIISGDMVHHPVQIVHPDWPSVPDYDREAAMAMPPRRRPGDRGRGGPASYATASYEADCEAPN